MRRFTYLWAAVAVLTVLVESVGATAQTASLWDNVVCMSLPVFVIALLLPAEDIVGIISERLRLGGENAGGG